MSLNKTPGSEGLPVEFYKVFWSDISDHLLNALNYAYYKGQLSVSQKRGVIKLIPKKDAEPYYVKNRSAMRTWGLMLVCFYSFRLEFFFQMPVSGS